MEHCVFIQTNHKQIVGAKVAAYALRRFSQHNDQFDVRIIDTRDYPCFEAREGQSYLRDGVKRVWLNDDLQSFTPTRFMPPALMNYTGRALVIDPDVFAAADVWALLNRDMGGKAILCRMRSGPKGLIDKCFASSVMLLDCAQLKHWDVEQRFNAMFDFTQDYQPWVCLKDEPRDSIGFFEPTWNDFDHFTPETRMLHTTRRKTQPWKTGLPVDWRPAERFRLFPPAAWLLRLRRHLFGEYGLMGNYRAHPDRNQERFFFGLVKECLAKGLLDEPLLRAEMARNHVRHDLFEVLARTPDLPPAPLHPLSSQVANAA
ncbi:MAG: hypothetical protein IPH23_09910 [Gammaproteobacteria bacterium]|nr:hypothetical protein [Gammaproteobacteria bacterium]